MLSCMPARCCAGSGSLLEAHVCHPPACSLQGTGLLNGRSEELLGKFTAEYPGSRSSQASICIATKLAPYPWRVTAKQFVAACR